MSEWTREQLRAVGDAEELRVAGRRTDDLFVGSVTPADDEQDAPRRRTQAAA